MDKQQGMIHSQVQSRRARRVGTDGLTSISRGVYGVRSFRCVAYQRRRRPEIERSCERTLRGLLLLGEKQCIVRSILLVTTTWLNLFIACLCRLVFLVLNVVFLLLGTWLSCAKHKVRLTNSGRHVLRSICMSDP